MISLNFESDFKFPQKSRISKWLSKVILAENKSEGEINYIFCDDQYLLRLNQQYLKHDTLTDIISFDYSLGNELHGDIYISIERVKENAVDFNVEFIEELKRVMVHGILHFCGYKDKTGSEKKEMRARENLHLATSV